MITRCPACRVRDKGTGKYLCYDCWHELRLPVRKALKHTDMKAYTRLTQLYNQIHAGVPLAEITVTA